MTVDVEDGRAVAIGGDPDHRFTQGFLCAKVNRYLERVYSPERLLHPMKRVGRKGEGRFERISWDEALDTIAARFRGSPARTARRRSCRTRTPGTWASSATGAWTGASSTRSARACSTGRSARRRARTATRRRSGSRWGTTPRRSSTRASSSPGARTSSARTSTSGRSSRRRGGEGRSSSRSTPTARAPPRRPTATSRRSPGTDAALALGMMHVVFRDGLEDQDYLERHAVGLEELRERAREWTPARTAATTGLPGRTRSSRSPASTRRRGPRRSASTTASTATPAAAWRCGRSPACPRSSGPGATSAAARSSRPRAPSPVDAGRPPAARPRPPGDAHPQHEPARAHPDRRVLEPPVKALYVYNSNPAAVAPEQDAVRRGLAREDLFVVVHEQFQTDTADFADIVLPATTTLEHFDLHKAYGHLYVSLSRPAIAPARRGACRTPRSSAASPRGWGSTTRACARPTSRWRGRPSTGTTPSWRGSRFERLEREGSVRLSVPEPFAPFREGGFPTPSGKCELLSEKLGRGGARPRGRLHPAPRGAHERAPSSPGAIRSRSSRRPPITS